MRPRELTVATALAVALSWSVADAQPSFSHYFHLEEEGIACLECHAGAASSASSADELLPADSVCLDCHDPGDVVMSWPPQPREFHFSHAEHGEALGRDCETCHAGLRQEEEPEVLVPPMSECMTCHNGLRAPRDCSACHTTAPSALIPDSHAIGWKDDHGPVARLSDDSCVPCHAVSDCQECHDGALLNELATLGAALQTPFAPTVGETGDGMVLQRVHGLNFRFLHALEARGKSSECITCHELDSGDFCAECHNPDDAAVRPVWHGGAGWVLAVSGGNGGRHAETARRDIENCIACHDLEAAEPACATCHREAR